MNKVKAEIQIDKTKNYDTWHDKLFVFLWGNTTLFTRQIDTKEIVGKRVGMEEKTKTRRKKERKAIFFLTLRFSFLLRSSFLQTPIPHRD